MTRQTKIIHLFNNGRRGARMTLNEKIRRQIETLKAKGREK